MTIVLSKEASIEFFYNALCNGLSYVYGYGVELDYNDDEYILSRYKLLNPCIEDVLIQMLKDGYSLTMKDIEGEGENDATITLKDVIERMPLVPADHLLDMHNEEDDADTADAIIQTVFFKEIIFG